MKKLQTKLKFSSFINSLNLVKIPNVNPNIPLSYYYHFHQHILFSYLVNKQHGNHVPPLHFKGDKAFFVKFSVKLTPLPFEFFCLTNFVSEIKTRKCYYDRPMVIVFFLFSLPRQWDLSFFLFVIGFFNSLFKTLITRSINY